MALSEIEKAISKAWSRFKGAGAYIEALKRDNVKAGSMFMAFNEGFEAGVQWRRAEEAKMKE